MDTARVRVRAHLHDKAHRRHLYIATIICLVEIAMIIHVEVIVVHLIATFALFGRDATGILLSD